MCALQLAYARELFDYYAPKYDDHMRKKLLYTGPRLLRKVRMSGCTLLCCEGRRQEFLYFDKTAVALSTCRSVPHEGLARRSLYGGVTSTGAQVLLILKRVQL